MLSLDQCEQSSDEELAAKALADQQFFDCLMIRYEEPLKRYVRRISSLKQQDVEDVVQDVFLKTYLNLNGFDPALKFSSWLYRIAHNEVISNFRKRSARHLDEQAALEDWLEVSAEFSAELELDQRITAKQVETVLAGMDPKYREVLVLRFMEEREYSEISDILQKPMGTVATLLNRAKKQFRSLMADKNLSI